MSRNRKVGAGQSDSGNYFFKERQDSSKVPAVFPDPDERIVAAKQVSKDASKQTDQTKKSFSVKEKG